MSRLRSRIARQGGNQAGAMGAYHPYGTAETPMREHLVLVEVGPQTSSGISTGEPGWNYARVSEMTPLVMPDGRAVPASAPLRWAQVFMAGRP